MFPRIVDGVLWVPVAPTPEGDDGLIGDQMEEMPPEHPDYEKTREYLLKNFPEDQS